VDFQKIILSLLEYWTDMGCIMQQPYDLEVGAGTSNPATFLRSLGPEPWKAVYVEPSRRPTDGRYGENPFRLQHYYQLQVVIKPSPDDIQDSYLKSLEILGINLSRHDVRFVEDDWQSPSLGASGLGWEVWIDGMEITQFTYFQQIGGIDLKPITVEITYGLERISMYLQKVDNVFDVRWNDNISYGDIHRTGEREWSYYNFEKADIDVLKKMFEMCECECKRMISFDLVMPANDHMLRCSHIFNLLEARRAFSVTERTFYINRVRSLSKKVALIYMKQREEMGYPLCQKI